MESGLVIGSLAFLIGLVWLGLWIFRKIMRGEIAVGVNMALLALLVIILLVPFAMNLSAHFLSQTMNHSSSHTSHSSEDGERATDSH